jgi:hypothetical protein
MVLGLDICRVFGMLDLQIVDFYGEKESGSRVARMPTHVMRLHKWGTRMVATGAKYRDSSLRSE